MNPYKYLAQQFRSMFRLESTMGPEAREHFSWQMRADFDGTHATVLKGGANTTFLILGDTAERTPQYPADTLEQLDKLARQEYWRYVVMRGDARRWFFSLQDALAVRPREGDRIGGVSGSKRAVTHVARANAVGTVRWIKK